MFNNLNFMIMIVGAFFLMAAGLAFAVRVWEVKDLL